MSKLGDRVIKKLQEELIVLSKKKSMHLVKIREIDNQVLEISNRIINYNKEN